MTEVFGWEQLPDGRWRTTRPQDGATLTAEVPRVYTSPDAVHGYLTRTRASFIRAGWGVPGCPPPRPAA